jgi:biotin carboxyl carrier protein
MMSIYTLNSVRRTGQEIGGMLLLAGLALACVAAVNHRVDSHLGESARDWQGSVTVVGTPVLKPADAPAPIPPTPPAETMITSPMAGVFKASTVDGGPALATVGKLVQPDTVLGTVEPMDATPIPILAGVSGKVSEILVKDQQLVGIGEALINIQATEFPQPAE